MKIKLYFSLSICCVCIFEIQRLTWGATEKLFWHLG